jgi:hypothetical protein
MQFQGEKCRHKARLKKLILKNRIPNFEKKHALETKFDIFQKSHYQKMQGISAQKAIILEELSKNGLEFDKSVIQSSHEGFLEGIRGKKEFNRLKIYLTQFVKKLKDFFDKI